MVVFITNFFLYFLIYGVVLFSIGFIVTMFWKRKRKEVLLSTLILTIMIATLYGISSAMS